MIGALFRSLDAESSYQLSRPRKEIMAAVPEMG